MALVASDVRPAPAMWPVPVTALDPEARRPISSRVAISAQESGRRGETPRPGEIASSTLYAVGRLQLASDVK